MHHEQERASVEERTAERKVVEEMAPLAEMYYELGGEDVRESATEFLESIDVDGDGRVSLTDYLSFMDEGPLRHQKWFNALAKGAGRGRDSLGPRDVRPLYYMLKSGRPFCKGLGCQNFVGGVYFTCVNCYHGSPSSFSVCLQCYESNRFRHEHIKFLDNFALLEAKRTKLKIPALKSTAANREDSGCEGAETIKSELHRIAMVYYRSTLDDQQVQIKIKKFVNSVPFGRDRRVALHDFLEFMDKKCDNNQNFKYMNTPSFFKILDRDKQGLDLVDVRTLYYVVQSGRPFCRGCRDFLAGTFFTCVTCFERSGQSSFCLCLSCLRDNKLRHDHHRFRDNYVMLQEISKKPRRARTAAPQVNIENYANRLRTIVDTLDPILGLTAQAVSLSAAGGCVIT